MVEINLLPWRIYQRQRRKKLIIIFLLLSSVIILFSCFFLMNTMDRLQQNELTIKKLKNQLAHYQYLNRPVEPLPAMRWVGFIQRNHEFFGVVTFPDGKTQEVQVGSIIGKQQARVIHLDEH